MKKIFKANNISCMSCANLIKGTLEDEFGTIEVNLETTPREVSVEITNDEQEKLFKEEMADMGFEIIKE